MPAESPFGQATRIRVLDDYLATAGELTAENAWEHVYKCLLWMNRPTGLAHIYDSNHMQPGGNFHGRAIRFTDALCERWTISRQQLPALIDKLFKGCVAAWRAGGGAEVDPEIESELTEDIRAILKETGMPADRVSEIARRIEAESRDFFTVEQKRKNALGEGFEDLLHILLRRVSRIPPERVVLRSPVSELPGFRKAAPALGLQHSAERTCPRPTGAISSCTSSSLSASEPWDQQ